LKNSKRKPMPSLTFQEEGHIYRYDKRIIAGVTTILGGWIEVKGKGHWYVNEKSGVLVRGATLDEAGDNGNAIHKGVKYILQGGVDWESLDPSLVAPLKEFGKFTRDRKVKLIFAEKSLYSVDWDFAGTPDIACTIDDLPTVCGVDVKSGEVGEFAPQSLALNSPGTVGAQTAGYDILIREELKIPRHRKTKRYCLELPKDGKPYKFYELKDKDDLPYFHAKLFAYKYDQNRR